MQQQRTLATRVHGLQPGCNRASSQIELRISQYGFLAFMIGEKTQNRPIRESINLCAKHLYQIRRCLQCAGQ